MIDIPLVLRTERHVAFRLPQWLASLRRRRAPAAKLDALTLSDHMLRDIGIQRGPLHQMSIKTPRSATRSSD